MMLYWCTRQRAGPLVKECRAIRPRFSKADDSRTRAEKAAILRPRLCAVSRRPADRLEIRLAVFGYQGVFYTLTYNDENLPNSFQDVRRDWRNFMERVRRLRKTPPVQDWPFDYAYAIEGKHSRWHIHAVFRTIDFTPTEVRGLWRNGNIDHEALLRKDGGFWRIAEYLNKERRGGVLPVGGHPWSVSRSVLRQVPPVERWRDESGEIAVPEDAVWKSPPSVIINQFGEYRFASWIERQPGAYLL